MAFDVVVPRLGWSMEHGTFSGWLKQDGDPIAAGDPLFQLEGDKALQDIESIDSGILRIAPHAPGVGQVVAVGTVIAKLTRPDEVIDWNSENMAPSSATAAIAEPQITSSFSQSLAPTPSANPAIPLRTRSEAPAGPAARWTARQLGIRIEEVSGSGRKGRISSLDVRRQAEHAAAAIEASLTQNHRQLVTPRARRAAARLGVSLDGIQGSGSRGRIRECDVLLASKSSDSMLRAIPVTARRRIIADRMRQSRATTVPVTLTSRFDASGLITLRHQFKELVTTDEVPSFQDMIVKLAVVALQEHPIMAGRWTDQAILVPNDHGWNIGFAVDTEDGLLVPVLKNVRDSTLRQIAVNSKQLIEQARQGRLTADEMSGGVFTVTNLGSFGIDAFTPIIRTPETSILGIGTIRQECVAQEDNTHRFRPLMTLSLTFDHCVVDGAPAARFLSSLIKKLENPSAALLSTA